MERELWTRGGMVLSILVLVVLILITPSLLGRPPPELASLPLLIIGMSRNESAFIVNLGGAVQAYRYEEVRLSVNGTVNTTRAENDTYGFHLWLPGNATFSVDAYFVDQLGNYFEYNVSARKETDQNNRTKMVFTFPLEPDNLNTVITRFPPEDFRWVIPRRGVVP